MTFYYFKGSFSQNGSTRTIVVEDGIAYNTNNGEELFNIEYASQILLLEGLSFASKRI